MATKAKVMNLTAWNFHSYSRKEWVVTVDFGNEEGEVQRIKIHQHDLKLLLDAMREMEHADIRQSQRILDAAAGTK